ncbi:hypothetical protein KY361_00235 [Candidatus Woesearchaeota archaeon]|nr:hypothetical protein [Candidatus Woesearchaeota archaeon]
MNPIDTIAAIFAVLVLIKMIMAVVNPKILRKQAKKILKHQTFTTIAYLVLIAILATYIFPVLSITQVAAVIFLTALVLGVSLVPHSDLVIDLGKTLMGKNMLKKDWLALVIWVGLAVWTLIAVIF